MWRSDTSSERTAGLAPAALFALLLAPLVAVVGPTPAAARVFLTVDEAIELAFPSCRVERETVYLTDAQRARAAELAGQPVETRIVYPYRARCPRGDGGTGGGGSVYFDTHRVRTLSETLMIVVDPAGKVRRVEVVSFKEPPDYIPREPWYRQFDDRRLDGELALKRGIHPVTGATLTARATTEAVRRVLALHRVIGESAEPARRRAAGTDTSRESER